MRVKYYLQGHKAPKGACLPVLPREYRDTVETLLDTCSVVSSNVYYDAEIEYLFMSFHRGKTYAGSYLHMWYNGRIEVSIKNVCPCTVCTDTSEAVKLLQEELK